MTTSEGTLTLGTLSAADRALSGRKAAALDELIRAGFAVPDGVVLPAAVAAVPLLESDISHNDADADDAVLARIADDFAGMPLAVRSSAPDEDGDTISNAGAYRSVLGVRGLEGLRKAVHACGDRLIPLIVQRQISADTAGVAFSANPVTGNRGDTIIEAVPGLGDAATNGSAVPERWTVRSSGATCTTQGSHVLTDDTVQAITAAAAAAEKLFAAPQDIEWACEAGTVYVVQSRPITALPVPPRTRIPPGTWLKETDRYPEPMTGFGASLAPGLVGDGLTAMFTYFGTLTDKLECVSVGGEMYQRVSVVGDRSAGRPRPTRSSAPPWWLLAVAARTDPTLRQRIKRSTRTASRTALAADAAAWEDEWRPAVREQTEYFSSVDLTSLSNQDAAAHLQELQQWIENCLRLHFRMIPVETVPLYILVTTCRDLLGWPTSRALELVAGTSTATSAPALALAPIAAAVGELPHVIAQLQGGADPAAVLADVDPLLAHAFAEWRRVYGAATISDDPGSPTIGEQNDLLIGLLTTPHTAPPAPRTWEEARAEARRELRSRRPRTQRRFERAHADALSTFWLREDVALWTSSVPGGLAHRACIDAGRRFAADDRIDKAEDVVHLGRDDIITALVGGDADLRDTVHRSRAERAWTVAHPGPARYGPAPAAIPNLRGLPRTARILNSALLWMRQSPSMTAADTSPGNGGAHFTGHPASPGRYTGRVRVIRTATDLAALQGGDVLVCPTTDPAWSVAFGMVGALVTGRGGTLSHAAIVAREFGVPAVVGVADITDALSDGDVVTVDGSTGTVRRSESPQAMPPAGRQSEGKRK